MRRFIKEFKSLPLNPFCQYLRCPRSPTIYFAQNFVAFTFCYQLFGYYNGSAIGQVQHPGMELLATSSDLVSIACLTVLSSRSALVHQKRLLFNAIVVRPLEFGTVFHRAGGFIGLRVVSYYFVFQEFWLAVADMWRRGLPCNHFVDVFTDYFIMDLPSVLPVCWAGFLFGRIIGAKVGRDAVSFTTSVIARGVDVNTVAMRYIQCAFRRHPLDVRFSQQPMRLKVYCLSIAALALLPRIGLQLTQSRDFLEEPQYELPNNNYDI